LAKKFKPGICVYCGKYREDLTPEHVLQRSLFPENRPRPSKLVIVPICKPCNDRKGGDDSYIREMFAFDRACEGNPIVRQLLGGPIKRSVQKGWSQFAKTAIQRGKPSPLFTDAGIYLGEGVGIPILHKRVQSWGRLVCRGLYYVHFGTRIPDHYEFETMRILDSKRGEAFDSLKAAGAHGPFLMGEPEEETDKVVSWMYGHDAEDPFRTIWMLWFYQSVFIQIHTGPPGEQQQLRETIAARKREAFFAH
jgi:hypothetical protein